MTRARHEEPLTAFEDAVRMVREASRPLEIETVPLAAAYDRVLAETVTAPHAVPPFDNSMVDGFAVRAADVAGASEQRPVELPVDERIPAGVAPTAELAPGRAARIMTGAPVPPGADAIVMIEWTESSGDGDRVLVKRESPPGRFVRRAGEDMEAGDRLLEAGHTLAPADVGVLASIGRPEVSVRRRPLVAVLATGDELLQVHEPLAPGKIRSSNNYTIAGQVRAAGGEAVDLGIARDDRDALRKAIERGRDRDVLITSGGVSVGDRDEVQDVLIEAGFERVFWRVAASPGKPLLFGHLGATLVFGLPGNPVSSMVAFENFVRPALRRLQGDASPDRVRLRARTADDLSGPEPRRHFARVRLEFAADGPVVREVRPHGSGNLRSMVHANALAIVPEGVATIPAGGFVEVVVLGSPDGRGGEF